MRAAWYERAGPARQVLVVGEVDTPDPARGEVRIRVAASGISPGDVKKRSDAFGMGMAYPRVIPHSDGAGTVDAIGDAVSSEWMGRRVWCFGAQSYRPFGTAAEYCVVPVDQVVACPESMSSTQGACLGIPGLTAHRAVHRGGDVDGKTVLVQGGAGAVGMCAVRLAGLGGARVIATVRREDDETVAAAAGAHEVVRAGPELVETVRRAAPDGVDHIVEVAFAANIVSDVEVMREGGTIATYATNDADAAMPFWPLVFKNVTVRFLGSDDFPPAAKRAAATALNTAFEDGWSGFPVVERFSLAEIAEAHQWVENSRNRGRAVIEW